MHSYRHSGTGETGNVIIGGYRVRDAALPSIDGDYVYTDDGAGDLRAYDPVSNTETGLGLSLPAPGSFGEGLDGSIYVTAIGNNKVYELLDSSAPAPPRHAGKRPGDGRGGVRLAKVGNFDSPDYIAGAPGVKHVTYVVQRAGKVIAVRTANRDGPSSTLPGAPRPTASAGSSRLPSTRASRATGSSTPSTPTPRATSRSTRSGRRPTPGRRRAHGAR